MEMQPEGQAIWGFILGKPLEGLKQGNSVIYLWLRDSFGYCRRVDRGAGETRRHRGRLRLNW